MAAVEIFIHAVGDFKDSEPLVDIWSPKFAAVEIFIHAVGDFEDSEPCYPDNN